MRSLTNRYWNGKINRIQEGRKEKKHTEQFRMVRREADMSLVKQREGQVRKHWENDHTQADRKRHD